MPRLRTFTTTHVVRAGNVRTDFGDIQIAADHGPVGRRARPPRQPDRLCLDNCRFCTSPRCALLPAMRRARRSGRRLAAQDGVTAPTSGPTPQPLQRPSSRRWWRLLESVANANNHPAVSRWAPSRYFRFDDGLPGLSPNRKCWLYGIGSITGTDHKPLNDSADTGYPRDAATRGGGQRPARRLGRARPDAACCSAHRMTSRRSQSLTRPLPRSKTGLGMSL